MLEKDTPITYDNRVFSVKGQDNTVSPILKSVHPRRSEPPPVTGIESDTVETDDDPVNDAIRAVIDADTDEEVVYPRSVRVLCLPKVSMINFIPS